MDEKTFLQKAQAILGASLRCDGCNEQCGEPLHGLCVDHIFCSTKCAGVKNCCQCNKPLHLENANERFTGFRELLDLMPSFQNRKPTEEKTPVDKSKVTSKRSSVTKQESSTDISVDEPARTNERRRSMGSMTDVNKRNKKGETLLHVACIKGDITEVKRLLQLKAKCSTRDHAGWTPLHEAVQQQTGTEIVYLLLQHGAGPNVPGGFLLNSPLHEAVLAGIVENVKLLMQFGGDPDQRNLHGETPKDLSKKKEILPLLEGGSNESGITSVTSEERIVTSELTECTNRSIIIMEAGLSSDEKNVLTKLCKSQLLTLIKTPCADVKVVVTAATRNLCPRSLPVLAGLMVGAWIVSPDWLEMCERNGDIVDPEPFEIYGVVEQTQSAVPKFARINFQNMMPGLFAGCHIFLGGGLSLGEGIDRNSLSTLVKLGGGIVLNRSPDPEDIPANERTIPWHADPNSPLAKCSHYIIYEAGRREPQMKYNMRHIKSLPHTWLLACMENFKILDPPSQL